MKINATQHIEVEISESEVHRIMVNKLKKIGGWSDDYYIDMNANPGPALMYRETFHTSHSWTETIFVRTATELDLAINIILIRL